MIRWVWKAMQAVTPTLATLHQTQAMRFATRNSWRLVSPNIWTMNADGSNLVQLTTGNPSLDPAWSPDGSKIAFFDSSTFELKVIRWEWRSATHDWRRAELVTRRSNHRIPATQQPRPRVS